MPIGEPALITVLILSAALGIWGLARVFQISARFTHLESSHDQRANVLVALATAEIEREAMEADSESGHSTKAA